MSQNFFKVERKAIPQGTWTVKETGKICFSFKGFLYFCLAWWEFQLFVLPLGLKSRKKIIRVDYKPIDVTHLKSKGRTSP